MYPAYCGYTAVPGQHLKRAVKMKKNGVLSEEGGFASAVAVCFLAVLLFAGGAAYSLNESDSRVVERFLAGDRLQLAADDGARLGCSRLWSSPELCTNIMSAGSAQKLDSFTREDGVACDIYASRHSDRIAVMAVSRQNNMRCRSIVYLKKKDAAYVVDHWEH